MEMGMSKFVKLTIQRSGLTQYVNSNLAFFYAQPSGGTLIGYPHILPDGDFAYDIVTETPEEILSLIEGPSGEYEPLCSDDEPF